MVRHVVETRDPDEVATVLRDRFRATLHSLEVNGGLRLVQDSLGAASLHSNHYSIEATASVDEPMPETYVARLRAGTLTHQIDRQEYRWAAGDVFLAMNTRAAVTSIIHDCEVDFAVIDRATFAAVASSIDGAPVALTGSRPVSSSARRSWIAAFEFAQRVAAQDDATPLVAGTTARLLAATALETFPNNAHIDPTIEDRHDARPSTLRRAVAYIDGHPDLDLTVVDIARAAFVTPRAVQLAFRRHLDTTPLSYLRRVRLERAHVDLQRGDPTVDTVTAVAARWGWARPSRFAADYRAAYGCHPHETLRS